MSNFSARILAALLRPEAHDSPYLWASVALAHASIGVALWLALSGIARRPWAAVALSLLIYGLFEAAQAAIAARLLIWDCLLDWSAVGLGAATAAALYGRALTLARLAVLSAALVACVGWWWRG